MEFIGFFLTGIIFLGIIILFLAYVTNPKAKNHAFKSGAAMDLERVSEKWVDVKAMIAQGGPANFRQAIIQGDKLVENVLGSRVSGETMGERLRNSRNLFSRRTYNDLWTAHKIRNKVVHDADFEGLSSDAKLCVESFERALKELKAI